MISAVVLAAGFSRRMGKNKMLLKLCGREILLRTLDAVLDSKVDEIIVVVGHESRNIKDIIKDLPVKIIYNPLYKKGQSTSVKIGLKNVSSSVDGVIFILGDLPLVSSRTINKLIDEFIYSEQYKIIVPFYNGKRGNPVIFSKEILNEKTFLNGDEGARSLIKKYEEYVKKVEIFSPEIITDIDTLTDLKRAEVFFKNR